MIQVVGYKLKPKNEVYRNAVDTILFKKHIPLKYFLITDQE